MKIYIDRPHGCGQDRGASSILNEEIWADKMIDLVVPKLKSLGHTVLAQRPSGNLTVQQSLSWRCQQADNWGADIFISNHNNAGGGYGAEVYTYKGELLPEATRYLQYIINHGGSVHSNDRKNANAGIKNGSGLAVINGTGMKAMLLENFYVDTKSDCDFFSNNIEMFANALVYGITGVDLESENNTVSTPSPVAPPPSPKPEPVVETKVDVTYQVYTNGRWLPNVKNLEDYAGIWNQPVSGVYASLSKGSVKYRVHTAQNGWLPWVIDRQDYAGIIGKNIDGLQMQLLELRDYSVKYRVYVGGRWLPWVADLEDYAGVYGQSISEVQVDVVSK